MVGDEDKPPLLARPTVMENQANGFHYPLRVFVFDNLRVRSHIFSRMFSEHSELKHVYHPVSVLSQY